MNIYYVTRPYCTPNGFNVLADSRKEAITISNKIYGTCDNIKARKVKLVKGVLTSDITFLHHNASHFDDRPAHK